MPEPYKFQWEMIRKALEVPNFLCGDDMGLGKTVEAVILDKERRKRTRELGNQKKLLTLVVCPLSVFSVWEDHFATWNPSLRVVTLNRKDRGTFVESAQKGTADVLICHWEALAATKMRQAEMLGLWKIQWFHIIADEAHRAKNRKAQQTVGLKKLPVMYKTALTGTPADNRPQDIWSILNWLYPRTWSGYWNFFNRFVVFKNHTTEQCQACDKYHKNAYKEIVGVGEPEEFHRLVGPYFIRRLKEDPAIGLELPEKYYSKIEVDLHPQQKRTYDEMRRKMLAWVGEHENEPIAAPIVVAQLVRLQQFAGAYARLETVKVRNKETGELDDKLVVRLTEPSSKLDALMELINDNEEKKFVVFSQSRQLVEMLAARLARANVAHCLLTGNTKQEDRPRLVARFQIGDARVFAGTVSAGGVGLTLTAGSVVVFTDRHPSPAINKQAEDRLHRIGQRSNVQVIDLVARGTMDQQRIDQVEMKWEIIKKLLGDE